MEYPDGPCFSIKILADADRDRLLEQDQHDFDRDLHPVCNPAHCHFFPADHDHFRGKEDMRIIEARSGMAQHHPVGITDKTPVDLTDMLDILALVDMLEKFQMRLVYQEFFIKSFGPGTAAQDIPGMGGKDMQVFPLHQLFLGVEELVEMVPADPCFCEDILDRDFLNGMIVQQYPDSLAQLSFRIHAITLSVNLSFHSAPGFLQRILQSGSIFAAGLGHIGTAAAVAAHDLSDSFDDPPGMDAFCHSIFGRHAEDIDFIRSHRSRQDNDTVRPVTQLVAHGPQRFHILYPDFLDQDGNAFDIADIISNTGSSFCRKLLLEAVRTVFLVFDFILQCLDAADQSTRPCFDETCGLTDEAFQFAGIVQGAPARHGFDPADTPVARWLALQNPPLTAFFWDYDGTLVDSYPAMVRFLARAAERLGISVSESEAIELMKHSLPHAISILCRGDADMETRLMAAFREEETRMTPADTPLLPGIREAFDALSVPGARHFLVTHNSRRALDTLKAHGLLDFFTDWVTRENAFPRKPDPAAILALMRRHGVQPEEAVMIGDRPLDMEAGSAAGILTCLLDTDGRFADIPCELRASRAGELPALLAPKKPVIG